MYKDNITDDNMLRIVQCNRCQHKWATKLEEPRFCPRCKSPYWNKKRVR